MFTACSCVTSEIAINLALQSLNFTSSVTSLMLFEPYKNRQGHKHKSDCCVDCYDAVQFQSQNSEQMREKFCQIKWERICLLARRMFELTYVKASRVVKHSVATNTVIALMP